VLPPALCTQFAPKNLIGACWLQYSATVLWQMYTDSWSHTGPAAVGSGQKQGPGRTGRTRALLQPAIRFDRKTWVTLESKQHNSGHPVILSSEFWTQFFTSYSLTALKDMLFSWEVICMRSQLLNWAVMHWTIVLSIVESGHQSFPVFIQSVFIPVFSQSGFILQSFFLMNN
jgi:hypothetical protein